MSKITLAQRSDLPRIKEITLQGNVPPFHDEYYTTRIDLGNCHVLKAENKVVGYSLINDKSKFGPGLYVEALFVDKSYRNKGYGKQLFSNIVQIASRKKLPITAHTFAATGLLSKAGKYGFSVTKVPGLYKRMGGIDGYFLRCDL